MSDQDESARNEPLDEVEPIASDDANAAVATPAGLTRVREGLDWSLADVAARLRMNARQIEALEAGDWDSLPGTAFVRGALRAYGRLLDCDVSPLLGTIAAASAGLDMRGGRDARRPMPMGGGSLYGAPSSGNRWGLGLLGLVAVVVIAFIFAPSTELESLSAWFDRGGPEVKDDSARILVRPPGVVGQDLKTGGSGPKDVNPEAAPSDAAVAAAAEAAKKLLGASDSAALGAAGRKNAKQLAGSAASSSAPVIDGRSAGSASAAGSDSKAGASGSERKSEAESSAERNPAKSGTTPAREGSVANADQAGADVSAAEPPAPARVAGVGENAPDKAAVLSKAQQKPAVAKATEQAVAAASNPAASLNMSFAAECWVEVDGAGGKRFVYGLQKPGTSISINAPGPLAILIGNADAVSLTRGGKKVDVRALARNGIAKLRLE